MKGAEICTFPGEGLVRALILVHVHVFSVNHVAGFARAALRAAGLTGGWSSLPCARAGAGRLLRLAGLIECFGHLVQRRFYLLGRRANSRSVAFAAVGHGLLGFLESLLRGFHFVRRQLLAVFANGLLGLVHDAVQPVTSFDFFHAAAIVFGMRFGLDAHLFRLFLGQAGGGLNGDLLFLAGSFVLG